MVELALPNAFCLSLGQAFQVLAIDIDFDVLRQREPSFMHSVFAQLPERCPLWLNATCAFWVSKLMELQQSAP